MNENKRMMFIKCKKCKAYEFKPQKYESETYYRETCFGREQRITSATMKCKKKNEKANEQDSVVTLLGKSISSSRTLEMDRLIDCFISIC